MRALAKAVIIASAIFTGGELLAKQNPCGWFFFGFAIAVTIFYDAKLR